VKKRHRKHKEKTVLDKFRKALRDPQPRTDCTCIAIVPWPGTDPLPDSVQRQAEAHFAAGAFAVLVLYPFETDGPGHGLAAYRSQQGDN
jgi:hypothetical protein